MRRRISRAGGRAGLKRKFAIVAKILVCYLTLLQSIIELTRTGTRDSFGIRTLGESTGVKLSTGLENGRDTIIGTRTYPFIISQSSTPLILLSFSSFTYLIQTSNKFDFTSESTASTSTTAYLISSTITTTKQLLQATYGSSIKFHLYP